MPKILIVDDEKDIRESVKLLLARGNYNDVVMASDGLEALKVFQEEQPDLIITDVNMPNCSGIEFVKRLREYPEASLTPIVMLSARTAPQHQTEGLESGADIYVCKPIERDQRAIFLAQIGTLLKKSQRHAQAVVSSMKDPLTELPRREAFSLLFKQQVVACSRNSTPLGISILDIDFFKKVNDIYGHIAGDSVLKQFARIVKENIRASDEAFRFGGEEFVVLLPNANAANSLFVLNRIRDKIKEATFVNGLKVSFSAGIFEINNGSEANMEEYLELADKALYEAKNTGRDRIIVSLKDNCSQEAS